MIKYERLYRPKGQKRWFVSGNTYNTKRAAQYGSSTGSMNSPKYEYKARIKK